MKFSMEEGTLVRLSQRTQAESQDLGVLVKRLGEATEPLEGMVNGPTRAAIDKFQSSTDEIAAALNSALFGLLGSVIGQNNAFVTAAEEGAATHQSAESSADFSSSAFLNRIGPR
ncbi:MAG: hypothetical protein Q4D96_01505 [Propionibacteriaceae bacterium]|nr:hypothetical protein [Propionibacteriaceae bacterium]